MKWLVAALTACLAAHSAVAAVIALPGVTPQRAVAGLPFPQPVAVRVIDEAGAPVPGATVTTSGDWKGPTALGDATGCGLEFMSVAVCQAMSDADGIARFPPMAARYAGVYAVLVRAATGLVARGETTLQFTADAVQEPARLSVVAGDGQTAVIGTPLAPVTVKLQSPGGSTLAFKTLYYSPVTMGPGGFSPPLNAPALTTDAAGMATLPPLVASWGIGAFEAQVQYIDEAARIFVSVPIRYATTNAQGGNALDFGALWWSGPTESGWGMSAAQHGTRLFNVFFVYDDIGRPTWYAQSNGTWREGLGGNFEGALYSPQGTPWFAYDASALRIGDPVGQANLYFRGPDAAWMAFTRYRGLQWINTQKDIVRQPFGRGVAAPLGGVADLWWGGASQNGWGLAIAEQGGTLFMVWFTYDNAGLPTWFVMPGGTWAADGSYGGAIYRTRGTMWEGVPFDSSKVQAEAVGTFALRFASMAQARMEVAMDGRRLTLELSRQPF